jgi:hypothetical protein
VRQALLAESATAACAQGDDLLVRVGPSGSDARLSKTVAVKIGRPIIQGEVISLPLLWEAVGTPALFPRVDASLEVVPLAPTLTQLSFFGRYDPPLGRLGQSLDQLLLHRLAEHTIRAFLSDVARQLRAGLVGAGQ